MQEATLKLIGWVMGMKVGATGRLALCSQNTHIQKVLARDKSASRRAWGLGV